MLSLLENSQDDLAEKRIGLYSYGSGSMGEFFSAVVQKDYCDFLSRDYHHKFLASRSALTYQQYEEIYNFKLPRIDGVFSVPASYRVGNFRLQAIDQHKRIYEKTS
jgi:hydroxymethylglutaryl-CoA synthase